MAFFRSDTLMLLKLGSSSDLQPAGLNSLPNELLFRIFGHFEASDNESPDPVDISTLCALCKVSRRVHTAAQDLLYRHCFLFFDVPNSKTRNLDPARFSDVNLFIRTLAWKPQLYHLVRSIHCRLADDFTEGCNAVNDLLAQLPNIRFVTLESVQMWHTPQRRTRKVYMPDFLWVNPASMLDTFQITNAITDMSGLLKIMTAGTIRTLIMHDFSATQMPQDWQAVSKSKHLTSLSIRRTRIAVDVLAALLSCTPSLKHLAIENVHWFDPASDPSSRQLRSRMWRPSLIVVALRLVRSTLESLLITEQVGNWGAREIYSINFREYHRLKRLSITSLCVFGFDAVDFASPPTHAPIPIPHGKERKGFWALLSPDLEHLTIQFPHSTGIFYDDLSGAEDFDAREYQPFEEYEWIEEIATHKSTHYPLLRDVRLIELPLGYGTGRLHDWTQPQPLQHAYDEQHLNLNVTLRTYPKPFG